MPFQMTRQQCYEVLEHLGFSWKKRVEIFHTELAELSGIGRLKQLAKIETER